MATARTAAPEPDNSPMRERAGSVLRGRAALRLLEAARSEEVLPILLEEILALGFPRALASEIDFDTGEIKPSVALNSSKQFKQRFTTSLWARDNPLVATFESLEPRLIPAPGGEIYCYPMVYRNRTLCWEAEREGGTGCLAVENLRGLRKVTSQEQVCATCDMRGYAAVVVVEVPGRRERAAIPEARALIDLANRYLSRLFKVEHYYNRMRDMDSTIAQMDVVMQNMPDPVILTDPQHRVIMQNRAAERFFKVPEEVSEGRVRAVELNNLLFSAALSSMAVSGGENSRDLVLVDAIEGEEVLFEAVSAPTFSSDGLRTGMVAVLRDITDLRRADEELRANYEKLRNAEETVRQDRDRLNLIIENVGDPIVVCDHTAKPVLMDSSAQELLGPESEGIDLMNPAQVKNRSTFDAYITGFTFSFTEEESSPLRLYNPQSRTDIEYDARSGKIYDQRGQVAYTVTVLRDLTAMRKLEQLRLERRMLEIEKFAATGRLAGTIAHEINNPMEAIKNSIYLLANSVKPEAEPVYEILKTETERVARIVRQMLGLYRSPQAAGNVDVNTVIEDTMALFSRHLERGGIQVKVELDKTPAIVGSFDQLRQVLSNLVVNAKDSMNSGGSLIIRTRHLPSNDGVHGWVRVLVADTGSGIPGNILATIFEPFVTTKGEKGTGLGLWIVKNIVENHGGRIRVRSRIDSGTVFKIDLPVVR